MFRARASLWVRFRLAQTKPFCTNTTKHNANNNADKIESNLSRYHEAYKQLDKLDFMTAAKMLFTEPPKKKKFGIDFHLVQLFFACMPSLAVYLVAQYARYEMRRMEAELEQKKEQEEKKKREEEEKAKELELKEAEEKAKSNPELLEVKTRLGKLEEALKEIVVESKKQSGSITKDLEDGGEKKHHTKRAVGDGQSRSESNNPVEKDHLGNQKSGDSTTGFSQSKLSGSAPSNVAPHQDQMSKTENGGPSDDAKR